MRSFSSILDPQIAGTGVAGVLPDRQAAMEAVRSLQASGFSSNQLLLLGDEEVLTAATEGRLGLPHEVENGQQRQYVAWGLLGGALLGLLLGGEVVALAGIAGLVATDTLFAGAAVGILSGGIYGDGLAELSASEQATYLRDAILSGRILVVVHARGQDEVIRSRAVLKASGAGAMHEWPIVVPLVLPDAEKVTRSHLAPEPTR